MSKKDGGPAFPNMAATASSSNAKGMTLRDYFAAKALQGLIMHYGNQGASTAAFRQAALAAYCFADAMIETREG